MVIDLHAHTTASPDGADSIFVMAERAAALGIDVLAATEHLDAMEGLPFPHFWGLNSAVSEYDETKTREDFLEARERYKGKIKLLYGLELGEAHLNPGPCFELTARQSFDVILGSVHVMSGDVDPCVLDYDENKPADIISRYYDDVLEMSLLGGFDVLAHLDYPVRYIPYVCGFDGSLLPFREKLRQILRVCAGNGVALEINGAGLRKRQRKITLEGFVIRDFLELGGELFTFGSDAHAASQLLIGRNEAIKLAKENGARFLAYYENRKPAAIKI